MSKPECRGCGPPQKFFAILFENSVKQGRFYMKIGDLSIIRFRENALNDYFHETIYALKLQTLYDTHANDERYSCYKLKRTYLKQIKDTLLGQFATNLLF